VVIGAVRRALRAFEEPFVRRREYGALFIRLLVGYRLVIGTQDNVFSYERMLEFEAFLRANGFPFPLFNAFLSAYAQFLCGLLFIVGLWVRPAAAVMVVNFIVALAMVHVGLPFERNFEALTMLFGSAFLLFNGAGGASVDAWLRRRAPARPGEDGAAGEATRPPYRGAERVRRGARR
jgi:putative oxidoreductase